MQGDRFKVTASLGEMSAETTVTVVAPPGAGISIKIEPIDLKNQRYQWKGNVLEVAAYHPSLRPYLGPSPEFPGQEELHFRAILAEIVADAVCGQTLRARIRQEPYDWESVDWDTYYSEYSRLMTAFLPTAHAIQVLDV